VIKLIVSKRRVPHTLAAPLAAGALLLVSALTAAAQDPLAKLDPASRNVIDVVMDSALVAGLPTRSILSRALEGVAKKAPNRAIVDAVRRRLVSLRTAHAVLGGVGPDELEAAASILEAGAKPEQLGKFRVRTAGRSDLEAFTVWADFLARGVPKDEASSAITKLWQDGADDATFRSLWNNVQSDILQGLNPGTALQNRIRESPMRPPTTAPKPPEAPRENTGSR
jgi:hypothetical protein